MALRQAILKAKASARGVEVPDAVLTYIAEHVRQYRELEGALYTVIAQAILVGRRIDLSLAQPRCGNRFATPRSRLGCAISSEWSAICFRSRPRHSDRTAAPRHRPIRA